jgi:hypothetical protein
MSQDSTEPSVAAAQHGSVSHLRPWRKGESGNPHGRAVRAIKLFEMMVTDFGELSAVESALLLQACRLMARSERASDANDAVRLANASARLLASLSTKKKRKPGRPSLHERIAAAEVEHA